MAVIRIFVEGGVVPHMNDEARTVANSAQLREALYSLLTQELNHFDFKLQLELGGGWPQTLANWQAALNKKDHIYLLIDLDRTPGDEATRKDELGIEEANKKLVFFMTQEMEAWFLSQSEIFDLAFATETRVRKDVEITSDPNILGKDPRMIAKPSRIVKTLVQRYFRTFKGKKLKYGKMREGASLLEQLNLQQLMNDFPQVQQLITELITYAEVEEE